MIDSQYSFALTWESVNLIENILFKDIPNDLLGKRYIEEYEEEKHSKNPQTA